MYTYFKPRPAVLKLTHHHFTKQVWLTAARHASHQDNFRTSSSPSMYRTCRMADITGGGGISNGEGNFPLGGLLLPSGSPVSPPYPLCATSEWAKDPRQSCGPQVGITKRLGGISFQYSQVVLNLFCLYLLSILNCDRTVLLSIHIYLIVSIT